MTSFSITPVAEFPPASADDFPNYIQFQADGVDLGGPDVDTVNFTGGSPTRGTGESSNILTVPLGGGGGGAEVLLLGMVSDGTFQTNDANPGAITWTVTPTGAVTGVEWDDLTNSLTLPEGTFELVTAVDLTNDAGTLFDGAVTVRVSWALDDAGGLSTTTRMHPLAAVNTATDSAVAVDSVFVVSVAEGGGSAQLGFYFHFGEATKTLSAAVNVIVRQIA